MAADTKENCLSFRNYWYENMTIALIRNIALTSFHLIQHLICTTPRVVSTIIISLSLPSWAERAHRGIMAHLAEDRLEEPWEAWETGWGYLSSTLWDFSRWRWPRKEDAHSPMPQTSHSTEHKAPFAQICRLDWPGWITEFFNRMVLN